MEYLLRLSDGVEYGPVDVATLRSWRAEGRVPDDTFVRATSETEWQPVRSVLEARAHDATEALPPTVIDTRAPVVVSLGDPVPARAPSARPATAVRPAPSHEPAESGAPSTGAPARARRRIEPASAVEAAPAASPLPRLVLLVLGGLALVFVLLAGLYALLRPRLREREERAALQSWSTAERRVTDPAIGLTVELPQGWVVLKPENPLIPPPDARLELAQPAAGLLATLNAESLPGFEGGLDAYLDRSIAGLTLTRPGLRSPGRADAHLGRGNGRLARLAWDEGGIERRGLLVATSDAWNHLRLLVWGDAARWDGGLDEAEALLRGVLPSGALAGRVAEEKERLEHEAPELSPAAVRLMVEDRLSRGQSTADLPATALQLVSRGLAKLSAGERTELGQIYAQVWGPLPEDDRVRLAAYLGALRAGRTVPAEQAEPLRLLVKQGVLALPEESRARLQALNEQALRAGWTEP